MEINLKMAISLTIVAMLGFALLFIVFTYEDYEIKVTEKCHLPWSTQIMEDEMCTRTIYCDPVSRFFNKECKEHDASLGANE